MRRPTVAAVLPLFDEERTIGALVRDLAGRVDDVIVVDDGSRDSGPALARDAGARVIPLGSHRGIGAAIRAGLIAAKAAGNEAVVVMATNGKDDPAQVGVLLDALFAGHDYIQGSRFLPGGVTENLPPARRLLIKGYSLVFRLLTGVHVTDATNGFRAYRLALLDDPRIRIDQAWLDTYELEYYIHWKVLTLGYRVREVAVAKRYPPHGRYSKIRPFVDWWRMIRPVIFLALRLRR